jgi:hypothetical protein
LPPDPLNPVDPGTNLLLFAPLMPVPVEVEVEVELDSGRGSKLTANASHSVTI